jgi:hypothetical protein
MNLGSKLFLFILLKAIFIKIIYKFINIFINNIKNINTIDITNIPDIFQINANY